MNDFRKMDDIDIALYGYEDIKQALNDKRDVSAIDQQDPTADRAIDNLENHIELDDGVIVENADQWVRIVTAAYHHFCKSREIFVLSGEYGKQLGYRRICKKCNVSKSEFYRMMERIRAFVLAAACQVGIKRVL